MASDNINQVGKYIKKTNKDTGYALNRYKANVPRIERVRDIFDPTNSFSMTFDLKPGEDQTLLDLQFNKPPPIANCSDDCLNSACESFILTEGNHFITLQHPYNVESIRVFDNNVFVDPVNIDENDPAAGQLFIQGISGLGPVVVCYTYNNSDCDFHDDQPCPDPGLSNLHVGLTPIWTHRFDSANSIDYPDNTSFTQTVLEPSGGCGIWLPETQTGGSGNTGTAYYENYRVAGDNWELVISGELANINSTISASVIAGFGWHPLTPDSIFPDGSLGGLPSNFFASTFYQNGTVRITFPYRYNFQESDGFGGLLPYSGLKGFSSFTKILTVPKVSSWAFPTPFFARFSQVSPGGWYFKMWRQDEAEPDSWDIIAQYIDVPAATNKFNVSDAYIANATFNIFYSNLNAITMYGAPGQGRVHTQDTNNYELDYCRSIDDGYVRFGFCSEFTSAVTKVEHPGINDEGSQTPSYQVNFSWPSFVDGPGAVIGGTQSTARFNVADNPVSVRVKGQVLVPSWWGYSFGVVFSSYGADAPAALPESLIGNTIGSATAGPTDWVDFDITVPASLGADGISHYQWGVGLVESTDSLASSLPRYEPPFLFANNTPITISIRNVEVWTNGVLDCTTGPFCPDSFDNFAGRGCTEMHDNTFGSVPKFCNDSNPLIRQTTSYTAEGKIVQVTYPQGVSLSASGGELTVQYYANGNFTISSGGRCARKNTIFSGDGTTDSSGITDISYPSPFNCDVGAEGYVEVYIPTLPSTWISTGSATRNPSLDVTIGGQTNGPSIDLTFQQSGDSLFIHSDTGNNTYSMPFIHNEWMSVRFRVVNQILYTKIWQTSASEPSGWDHTLAVSTLSNVDGFGLEINASAFKDDSIYVKVRNLSVIEIPDVV